jgi:hypothetical protein
MERQSAAEIRKLALQAVSDLTKVLKVVSGHCSDKEYEEIRRAVGLCIGGIQVDLLDIVYAKYPELDDLKGQRADTERA